MVINIDDDTNNPYLFAKAEGIVSADYKERFVAEYVHNENRYKGLKAMIEKWDAGTLPFTPKCPRETYDIQLSAQKQLHNILVIRAKMEGINLPFRP